MRQQEAEFHSAALASPYHSDIDFDQDTDDHSGDDRDENDKAGEQGFDSILLSIVQSTSSTGDIIYDLGGNGDANGYTADHLDIRESTITRSTLTNDTGPTSNHKNLSVSTKTNVSKPVLDRSNSALQEIVKAAENPFFHAMISVEGAPSPNPNNHPDIRKDMESHLARGDSDDSFASAASFASGSSPRSRSNHSRRSSNSSSNIYKLKDSNTGKVYDLRQLEVHGSNDPCFEKIGVSQVSLFPTEGDLRQNISLRDKDWQDCIEGESASDTDAGIEEVPVGQGVNNKFSPGKAVKSFMSRPFSKMSLRNRNGEEDEEKKQRHIPDDNHIDPREEDESSYSCQGESGVSVGFSESQYASESEFTSGSESRALSVSTNDQEMDQKLREGNDQEAGLKKFPSESLPVSMRTSRRRRAHSGRNKKGDFNEDLDVDADSDAGERKKKNRKRKQPKRRREKKLKAQPIPLPKNTVKCNRKHKKQESDFHPLLLISAIEKAHDGPIWCSAFSEDGKFLATGGRDGVVQIWELAPKNKAKTDGRESPKDGRTQEERDDVTGATKGAAFASLHSMSSQDANRSHPNSPNYHGAALGTDIIVINPNPIQRFKDHEKDVVDLSWSNTGFLISASLDKTARLWHPSRHICLSIFKHPDAVTAVAFHPNEDKYFLSGGFDKMLRIWNIPNGRVAEWAQAPEVITAVTYVPDMKSIAAGLFNGKVYFYALANSSNGDKLRLTYYTQITTKPKGKKQGKKVTGLTFLRNLSDDKVADLSNNNVSPKSGGMGKGRIQAVMQNLRSPKKKKVKDQLLITTNDSRLRLVGMKDFCMVRKYKGHANTSLQIRAHFSESGEFIISGSELRGSCAIWNTATKRNPLNVNVTGLNMYDKVKAHEWFEATEADPAIVTDATFAPSVTVKEAILSSGLFPTLFSLNQINHDFSSSVIVSCDYEGTMRVFLRRSCFDSVSHAAGPGGYSPPEDD